MKLPTWILEGIALYEKKQTATWNDRDQTYKDLHTSGAFGFLYKSTRGELGTKASINSCAELIRLACTHDKERPLDSPWSCLITGNIDYYLNPELSEPNDLLHKRKVLVTYLNYWALTEPTFSNAWGKVYTTESLGNNFEVLSFLAPFVIVRKSDYNLATLMFTTSPRLYFGYQEIVY